MVSLFSHGAMVGCVLARKPPHRDIQDTSESFDRLKLWASMALQRVADGRFAEPSFARERLHGEPAPAHAFFQPLFESFLGHHGILPTSINGSEWALAH